MGYAISTVEAESICDHLEEIRQKVAGSREFVMAEHCICMAQLEISLLLANRDNERSGANIACKRG